MLGGKDGNGGQDDFSQETIGRILGDERLLRMILIVLSMSSSEGFVQNLEWPIGPDYLLRYSANDQRHREPVFSCYLLDSPIC